VKAARKDAKKRSVKANHLSRKTIRLVPATDAVITSNPAVVEIVTKDIQKNDYMQREKRNGTRGQKTSVPPIGA
jgi:hypothetical protein